jgi:hypothetical protein
LSTISAASTVQTTPPVSAADPGATNLATYLNALGIRLDVNILSNWLSLVPVLALEVGSLFAGLLSQPASRTPISPAVEKRLIGATGEPPLTPVITPANDLFNAGAEAFTETTSKLRVSDDPSERLVDLLRMSGGEVFGGQRTFAKAIGISPAYVNGLLHDLKAAGKVALNVGKNGTRVRLVA